MKKFTLFDYVKKYGNCSFQVKKFNEIDASILAALSYVNFKDLVPSFKSKNKKGIALNRLYDKEIEDYLLKGTVTTSYDKKLLELCAASSRFGNIILNYSTEYFDKEKSVQFFAITYIINDNLAVAAFRGTDLSIVGWKDNFLMSLSKERPVYSVADAYLTILGHQLPNHSLIVTGHSKGGALATYASCFVEKEIQDRILKVYDFDGPGFHNALEHEVGFNNIKDRIIKILPADSIVGILLETNVDVKVVQAKGFSIMQHMVYQWYVYGENFILSSTQTPHSILLQESTKEFLLKLTEKEKSEFIEIFFSIIHNSEIEKLTDFVKRPDRKIISIIKTISSILKDSTKGPMFKKVLKTFVITYFACLKKIKIPEKKEISNKD